ncbi:class I SAM-dependent methyltransferase [Fulvivirga sp.]|uniref:class I SAM-dependent methyltransferase n=1 Tax=Fulvivirga sp. TaxID=1931237 RepID=UPI0032EF5610
MCNDDTSRHTHLGHRLNKSQGVNPRAKIGISTSVVKCKNCGLIYNQPMPIPNKITDHYNMEITDYWENPDQLYREGYFKDEIEVFKRLSGAISDRTKALDVGSGLGQTVVALNNAGFDAVGIEPSKSFYDGAIKYSKLSEKHFINNSFEDETLEENEFDLITCPNVIEHVYDPSQSILKCIKSLKPGGLLYICVPSSNWLRTKLINLFYKITMSGYVTNTSPMHPPFHLHEFSKQSFYEHASKHGYQVELITIFPDKVINIPVVRNVFKAITKLFNLGIRMDVWIRKPITS